MKGATFWVIIPPCVKLVSIHAPNEGSDRKIWRKKIINRHILVFLERNTVKIHSDCSKIEFQASKWLKIPANLRVSSCSLWVRKTRLCD